MIEDKFRRAFDAEPTGTAYAPGRVNLIGEHIDYNGGMVLPAALPVGLRVALRPHPDETIRIASDRFETIAQGNFNATTTGGWADYANGAVIFAKQAGYLTGGADLYVESSIPDGAGLSSSAALIVAILKAARDDKGALASSEDIARLAQRVENDYIGVPCGIMDQMAVAVAREGQAIALDTLSLAYEVIDLPAAYRMAVIHSGQFRKLSDGQYAERRRECDDAKAALGVDALCLLTDDELKKAAGLPVSVYRRVRHCVSEHRRVKAAARALRTADMPAFGMLMNESHASMRDDFEISTPVIDALVDSAVRLGALGARLTGGGFGGCIVACVENNRYSAWKDALLQAHGQAQSIA